MNRDFAPLEEDLTYLEGSSYPYLRSVVSPELAALPHEAFREAMAAQDIDADTMEGLGGALLGGATGALQGAGMGAVLGPWGAAAGAVIGGAVGAISGASDTPAPQPPPRQAPPRQAPPAPPPAVAPPAPAPVAQPSVETKRPSPMGVPKVVGKPVSGLRFADRLKEPMLPASKQPAPKTSNNGNASTIEQDINIGALLVAFLNDPRVKSALMSVALGDAAKQEHTVGSTSVPSSAFVQALAQLAMKAFLQNEASAAPREGLPEYFFEGDDLAIDPGDPIERTARLIEMLSESEELPLSSPALDSQEGNAAEAYYDAIDRVDLAAITGEDANLGY